MTWPPPANSTPGEPSEENRPQQTPEGQPAPPPPPPPPSTPPAGPPPAGPPPSAAPPEPPTTVVPPGYSSAGPSAPPPGTPPTYPGGQQAYAGPPAPQGYPSGAYPVAQSRPTNTMAVISMILSLAGFVTLLSAPIGAILGHMARRQIRETGEEGDAFALTGIIVGWALTGLLVLGCCGGIAFFALAASTTTVVN